MSTTEENWRDQPSEQARIIDLLSLIPESGAKALDVGARDGYLSEKLTVYFDRVTALDLTKPDIDIDNVDPMEGDITELKFDDNSFDLILCAEVLEHIPPDLLVSACNELARVTADNLIIGVPYKQDTRIGRTTCPSCRRPNPPWGHVNEFDESKLQELFPGMVMEKITFVGTNKERTNKLSVFLLDSIGNPYGTYRQEELCIYCDSEVTFSGTPGPIGVLTSRLAYALCRLQNRFTKEHGNWIHVLLRKRAKRSAPRSF